MICFFAFSPESGTNIFDYLYTKYKNLLLNRAYAILRDRMLAEDAVSEAFIRVYRNLGKIADPDSGRCASFLLTIVKNTALTLRGRETGRYAESFDDTDDRADSFDLEQYVLSELSAERICTLLNGVSEELRSVFLLKYAHDLSHREIGRLLHITENNVTVRLHRARCKITQLLVKEGYVCEKE